MYKVHVGCLPACSTRESLVEFFKAYGDVREAKVLRKARSLCSGNGILICGDEQTQSRIVEIKTFFFNGRTIFCELMLSGAKLKEKNKELSERRVFLSNLPAHIQDVEIGRLMSKFGPVQNAYRIRSIEGEYRPFGFVTFYDIEAAHVACKARKAYFSNTTIYISDFRKSNLQTGATENTNHSVNSNNLKHVSLPSKDWKLPDAQTIVSTHSDYYATDNCQEFIQYETEHSPSEMFVKMKRSKKLRGDPSSSSSIKPTNTEYLVGRRLDKWELHVLNDHNVRINVARNIVGRYVSSTLMKRSDVSRCP